ncbi:MAG: efflux RND transporter periplasmic adaptor subunit [Gammaproteobacteria bacterium]|nr:efflux RND transporter periplasmic adaptor subunit [Gammaproteobacteria bacterium]
MWLTSQQPQFTPSSIEPPAFLVGVEVANRVPVTFEVASQGTVSPRTATVLVAQVSGEITEVMPSFVTGGFFKKGDELLKVDPRNYETAIVRADLTLARAKTRLATESALTGYALDDWKRLQELDPARLEATDLALRKPQLEEVMAEYEAAKAELDKAKEDLERTTIRAPYDGLVRQKMADVGQFVNTGFQLARTVAVDYAEVRLPIALSELQFVELPNGTDGTPLPVKLRAELGGESSEWDAKIVRTEGIIDEQSRVIHAVAQISDPYDIANGGQKLLRFGTFVHARIQGNDGGDLFVVPRHAVRNGTTMWIVLEDNTIQPREVSVVRSDEDFSYISNGINEGDVFCVTPIDRPLPGMKVRFDE